MKKPFKAAIALLAFAALLASAAGCVRHGVGTPSTPDEIFNEKFAEASTGKWTSSGGVYTVAFDKGSLTIDPAETRVAVCTPDAWPAVTFEEGTWRIDGTDTGMALAADASSAQILIVIYDGEGIYVRLSSGGMLYFHESGALDVGCFRFEKALNPSLPADVICRVVGSTISGDLGRVQTGIDLVPTFGSRGDMGVIGTEQSLTSSVSKVKFTGEALNLYLAKGGRKVPYTVSLDHGMIIPTFRISTGVGLPTSKEDYIPATITIEDPDLIYGDVASERVVTEIRGRGNTTWGMPKKPFKIKLDKKKRLLGMSDNKHWTLLANYSDKSLLRNSLAFKLSELAGMEWAVRWEPVEVYVDDAYQGQYMLTEQVRTGDERIEMELAGSGDNSGEALTGGYLFCIDEKDLEEGPGKKVGFWHHREAHPDWGDRMPVAFDEPEDPTQAQQEYAKDLFKEVEEAIYRGSLAEISELVDIDSFIAYFLVHELAKDPDGNMRLSTYIAKPRGGKLYFPCVWDFDISFGNCDYDNGGFADPTKNWTVRGAPWYKQLLRNKEFCDLVTVRWNELRPRLTELESLIRSWAADIDEAQKRNFAKWPILGTYVWPNWKPESRTTYKAEVDYLIDFINRRVAWLDGEINAGRHRNQ